MQRSRLNIFLAASLSLLFAIFNIGLPFALYVCPMMANERCTCSCTPSRADGPIVTYVHTPCCNANVLAERNTVPFLGTHKYEPPHAEVTFVLTSSISWAPEQLQLIRVMSIADTGPPPPNTPLYLLTSSLLI
jgi:hypothetical protein